MFKQVLSQLSESVVGGAKDYVKQKFSPEANKERAQDFLIENIRNLGARAPILSGVTSSIADNMASIAALNKLHDKQISDFLKSDKSSGMRESVQAQLGPNASGKKVEQEITKILTDAHTLLNKDGVVKAKENEFFKKNEKFFTEYQKSVLDSLKKSTTEPKQTSSPSQSTSTTSDPSNKLDVIADNTDKTVNILELIQENGTIDGRSQEKQPATIKGAIQSIGGNFLGKVFDEKTIEKFATATKSAFNKSKSTDKSTVVTQDTSLQAKVKSEAAAKEALVEKTKTTTDIESKKISVQEDIAQAVTKTEQLEEKREARESKEEPKATEEKKSSSTETEKETIAADAKIEGKQTSILDQILAEIKKLNEAKKETEKKETKKPLLEKALDAAADKVSDYASRKLPGAARTVGRGVGRVTGAVRSGVGSAINAAGRAASYIPAAVRGVGTLAAGAGSLIGSAATGLGGLATSAMTGLGGLAGGSALTAGAGLAAAGAGGYALGKYAINPLIDKGLSTVTGKDTSLGSWIYDKMNPEADFNKPPSPEELAAAKTSRLAREATVEGKKISRQESTQIEIQKKTPAAEATRLSDVKDKQEAAAQAKSAQPIVINNTTAAPSAPAPQQASIVASSIRNQDSTFERVQMQDFWSRAK